jgi:hypothetical protein
MMVWIWVEVLRPAVLCLVLAYLIKDSRMNSMEVAIHLLGCGLARVLRCWGLSKMRCGGAGSVLHGVWQVPESAKDLFLGVDPQGNMYHHVSSMECPAQQTGALGDVSSWWRGL